MKTTTITIASVLLSLASHAASFDCAKASSRVEKLICLDADLSKLDEELSAEYKDAAKRSDAGPVLRVLQKTWLINEPRSCSTGECIKSTYTERIIFLRSVASSKDPESSWNGNYVRQYNGKADKTSEISIIGIKGNKAYISGGSFWVAPNADQGQVNESHIDSMAQITPIGIKYTEDGGIMLIKRNSEKLVITSENMHLAQNVSFDGTYFGKKK